MKITKRQLRRIIKESIIGESQWQDNIDDFLSDREANPHDGTMHGEPEGGHDGHLDLYLDLGSDGDFPTLNDGDSEKQWEVPHFTSASDFLDEVLTQLPGSTPDTIVAGEEMDLPDLPLSQVWNAVMDAGRIR